MQPSAVPVVLLPRHTPEAHGLSSAALLRLYQHAEEQLDALHSLMVLRHGCVVGEGWWAPYGPQHPHMLYSLSKSFSSTAVGLAAAEGLVDLDAPVLSLFPADAPAEPSDNLRALRVRQLLAMASGHQDDTASAFGTCEDGNWVRAFLAQPVTHKPGTHFLYNNGASYMLAAVVQKATGMTALEYLQGRLFGPLGIGGATWESSPQGINTGGWGLSVKTEDIARLGQLYLQQGMWQGKQLLPASWVAQATARQTSNGSNPESDWEQGYGYQFWRCRHGAFRGDGAFGQFCLVLPQQEMVVAITAGVKDMQAVLDLLWQDLLPALQAGPLPQDTAAQQALRERLAHLALAPQAGPASSPMAALVAGRTYRFAGEGQPVQALAFECAGDGCTLVVQDAHGEHRIACGAGHWRCGSTRLERGEPRLVAGSAAWTAPDTLAVRLCFYETPYRPLLTFRFSGDEVYCDQELNVSFGPTTQAQRVGRAG